MQVRYNRYLHKSFLLQLLFQPVVSRRNTRINLEWRIRNLPYSIETYAVTVDNEKKCLVVRTTNKKYFKILRIPELDRLQLPPQQESVQFTHKFNTLVISVSNFDNMKLLGNYFVFFFSTKSLENYQILIKRFWRK